MPILELTKMSKLFLRQLLPLTLKVSALVLIVLLNVALLPIKVTLVDAQAVLPPLSAVNLLRELSLMLLERKKKLKGWSTTIRKS